MRNCAFLRTFGLTFLLQASAWAQTLSLIAETRQSSRLKQPLRRALSDCSLNYRVTSPTLP